MISGTVASIFVERRIREGKGLTELKLKNHFIVCGWNPNVEALLRDLEATDAERGVTVVLVNWMAVEAFDTTKAPIPPPSICAWDKSAWILSGSRFRAG